MHHVFISYHRPDGLWVRALLDRLERHGLSTWIDQRDIPVSFPWLEEVNDAIVECDVFVRCASAGQRASANCAAEDQLARDMDKRRCTVTVGTDLDRCAAEVVQAMRSVDVPETARIELAVLSRDWDRANRPRSALVSVRQRRRLERGLHRPPLVSEVERSYIRASRTRTRRRVAVTSVIAIVFTLAISAQAVFKAARDRVDQQNRAQAQQYTIARAALADSDARAYLGLARVTGFSENEAGVFAEVVSDAFKYPVPDDAFTVPAGALRFASGTVGRAVTVVSRGGRAWSRATDAHEIRIAVPGRGAEGAPVRRSELSLRHRAGASDVIILRRGTVWRRVRFRLPVGHLRLSPDERRLAGVEGGTIEILDTDSGHLRTILRGNLRTLLDLRWSSDRRQMWGLTRGRVLSWTLQDGQTLLDDPSRPLEALLPSARADAVWVAEAGGTLREVDTRTGAVIATRRVPDEIKSAGGSADGTVAAVSGAEHEWLVSLTTHTPARSFDVRSCAAGRATFDGDERFYLPCIGGDLLAMTTADARVVQRVPIPHNGAWGARMVPGTSGVLVGERMGRLYLVSGGRRSLFWRNDCGSGIARIAVSPDGRRVMPVGPGTGSAGCSRIGNANAGGGWTWNALVDHSSTSFLAGAATFSRTGKAFAIGYSDGTIVMRPSVNITPDLVVTSIDGNIRDMLTLSDGSLLVASEAGELQRIPWCETCLSNRYLAGAAERRMRRAITIGVLPDLKKGTLSRGA